MASETRTLHQLLRQVPSAWWQITSVEESNQSLVYYDRTYIAPEGERTERVTDYAYSKGVSGRKADDISVHEHLEAKHTQHLSLIHI